MHVSEVNFEALLAVDLGHADRAAFCRGGHHARGEVRARSHCFFLMMHDLTVTEHSDACPPPTRPPRLPGIRSARRAPSS